MTRINRAESKANHLPEHLDPYRNSARRPLRGIVIVILAVAAISALATAGMIQLTNRGIGWKVPPAQAGVELIGVSQQLAVIVTNSGERREIKLLDTRNSLVQDITRGRSTALTAALSPSGKSLAFVSDSHYGPVVHVVDVEGGIPVPLAASAVLKAGEDSGFTSLSICEWTNVSWSSGSSRFLVFGCHKGESVIIVVSTGQALEPIVLADTRVTQEGPREAIWLGDHEILFNQESDATGAMTLRKISADDADASSLLVYGE